MGTTQRKVRRDRHARVGLLAAAFTVSLSIAPTGTSSAQADVSNGAACRFQTHLQLHAGNYRTTGSTESCSGILAGRPVTDGGKVEMWGHYVESWSADTGCTVVWRDGVFDAHIKEAGAFFDSGDLSATGGFDMAGSPVMQLTGTGDSDWQPFMEQGVATFTPDSGQVCGSLRSGILIQRVTLNDGGSGNPGADAAVSRYEAAEWGSQPGPSTHRHRTSRPHHKPHRHVRRHRGG